MTLRLQPAEIGTNSADRECLIVFKDRYVVAVLVHLSEDHDDDAGKWFLEAGFGYVEARFAPLFENLDEAQAWIEGAFATKSVGT